MRRPVDCVRQLPRTLRSYASHREPLGRIGCDYVRDRPETVEQCTRGRARDSRHCRKERLGGWCASHWLWSLGVGGTVGSARFSLAAHRQAVGPLRRVSLMARSQERYAEINHRETRAADCVRGEWSAIDVRALDQQVRKSPRASQLPDLAPEVTPDDLSLVDIEDERGLRSDHVATLALVRHRYVSLPQRGSE